MLVRGLNQKLGIYRIAEIRPSKGIRQEAERGRNRALRTHPIRERESETAVEAMDRCHHTWIQRYTEGGGENGVVNRETRVIRK